ncbi:MAG: tetratricopeptide repeat protein [Paludibacteraceae bacterium]
MTSLTDIKKIFLEGDVDRAIALLDEYVAAHPESDEAYFLRGNAYRKKENWQEALNNYSEAMELNPEGPATLAYNATIEVLDFFNKDMYNQ